MDPDTFRGEIGGAGSDVYWRRRMAVLIGVLVVVAVVAWACSSVSQPHRASDVAPVASGDPASDALLASLRTTTGPDVTPTADDPKTPVPSPTPARAARRPGNECRPDDLVVSLSGRREVYPAGVKPRFMLTLVNTGHGVCTADVGPRALEVRITSGHDRIWSSADCISGEGVEMRRLRRGIPYIRPVEWDRRRSAQDCRAERVGARPGTYVAVVRGDRLRSAKAVFHLR